MPLFQHMGRKSDDSRLFSSIKTSSPMMQNLLDIESRTGGERWLRAVDDELKRQKKTVELREGSSAVTRYLVEPGDKLMDYGRRLFGKQPLNEVVFGETSGRGGLPTGSSQVYLKTDAPFNNNYSQSLKGRNPYVQSLVDTLRHELGGHVSEQLTPGGPSFNFRNPAEAAGIREEAAKSLVGEEGPKQALTPRAQEVQRYFGGQLPRPDESY